ncbi:MAG TPA: DEAD/DEAH box helicase, partial [Phycisphaerae bacterium]|nr:DEAD/DEAH box helicase [Phycisphaerae bacterium]
MALNPIAYTEKTVRSFLKYQLTAYPFSDPRLHAQMRELLNLDHVRRTPLLKGPYISLSRSFKKGPAVADLVREGVFHPHMSQIIGDRISHLYGHQERAIRSVHSGKTTLISTGTGSGKTECFLYPVISKCLELRDAGEPAGISAVIVYPMNALAEDQLDRMRGLLAGSGITFGMYVGKTPEHEREVSGHRLQSGSTRADYEAVLNQYREQGRADAVHPAEEVCSREKMRAAGSQPRILLTNVKQLELLLTRQRDVELFDNARLDFLVFDEAHTFTGIQGAETACLIRRLRTFCGRDEHDTVCVATSATIVDQRDTDAGRRFASRFFGTPADQVECVHEEYEADPWQTQRQMPAAPSGDPAELLKRVLAAVEAGSDDAELRAVYQQLTGWALGAGPWAEVLHDALTGNEVAYQVRVALLRPLPLDTLMYQLKERIGRAVSEEELLAYLALGAAAFKEGRPVFRPVVHAFVRGIPGAVATFPSGSEPKLWLSSEDEISAQGGESDGMWRPPVYTCTTCGQHYYVAWLKDFEFTKSEPDGGQLFDGGQCYWEALGKDHGGQRAVLVDRVISQEEDAELDEEKWSAPLFFCRHCGSAHKDDAGRCQNCGATSPLVKLFAVRSSPKSAGYLGSCVSCTARGRRIGRRYREPMREVRAVNVSDVHVLAQDMVHHAERKRLLLFADNRQDAAFQAGWMKDHARRFRLRRLMADAMKDGMISVGDMVMKLDEELDGNDGLSRALIPEVWRVVQKEGSGGVHEDERRHFLRIQVLREVATPANEQRGLEPWGRLRVSYRGIDSGARFIQEWARRLSLPPEDLKGGIETLLDQLRRQRLLYDSRREIFSRWWNDGDREIQRGYMPILPRPQGMKLVLDAGDNKEYVRSWMGERSTLVRQIAQKWGVADDDIPTFLEALWNYLRSNAMAVLVPVTLKSNKGKSLANCSGVFQIDAIKLLLSENHGYYRCKNCRRKISRRTPNNRCMAWQCDGELEFIAEDPDNYDLQLLDQGYSMLRPEEHTAMVPQDQRERIENWFKGAGDAVNTLVCTPTLELGVDIGALDSVLLRNVPPLPANYWQR